MSRRALSRSRMSSGDPTYPEIHDFLVEEAWLLDHDELDDWSALLADDLVYRMPVRRSVHRGEGAGFDPLIGHFDEDFESMTARLERLRSDAAWAEDPPSRVRRFVSNVRVEATGSPDEFAVTSYLLVLRSRSTRPETDVLSMERHDVLRRDGGSFKIARRVMYLDQTSVHMSNLSIFF